MSPERARVFLCDDDKGWKRTIRRDLEMFGHIVVGEAETLEKALCAVKYALEGANVVVVDGNLGNSDDGKIIIEAILAEGLEVWIIGLSGSGIVSDKTDVNINKDDFTGLGAIITNL